MSEVLYREEVDGADDDGEEDGDVNNNNNNDDDDGKYGGDATSTSPLRLRPGCHFVYGGDMVDRGTGDLRVQRDIMQLKKSFPSRVHLILGNRDINKLRIISETHPANAHKMGPYWVPENTGATSPSQRLQWMLKRTMGCPDTFEFRRFELSKLRNTCLSSVSDDDVWASFHQSLLTDGLHWQLMEKGLLALKFNDILFIHGAVDSESLGYVPPLTSSDGEGREVCLHASDAGKLSEWLDALHAFKQSELSAIDEGRDSDMVWSLEGGYSNPAPGSRLMQYGMGRCPPPERLRTRSVVYNDFLSLGAVRTPCPDLCRGLTQIGIRRLVSGHKPHGDAPLFIRSPETDLIVCTADTSYSANVLCSETGSKIFQDVRQETVKGVLKGDQVSQSQAFQVGANLNCPDLFRGHRCVNEVIFEVNDSGSTTVRTHGVLHSGDRIEASSCKGKGRDWLGRCTKKGWWIKGAMGPDNNRHRTWLLTKSEGFNVWNRFAIEDEVEREL
mmetsp:Transcript_20768/g.29027  ORF Transcript_20768/g.29027 Transcript_20768/m.29027 type:complete len:500 (+) Transcript_20768:207-1706(+)